MIDFDQLLLDVPESGKEVIRKALGLEKLQVDNLFITASDGMTANRNAFLWLGTVEGMEEWIYSNDLLMCDLCFPEGEVVHVKPHPKANMKYFRKVFSEFELLDASIPMEYLH